MHRFSTAKEHVAYAHKLPHVHTQPATTREHQGRPALRKSWCTEMSAAPAGFTTDATGGYCKVHDKYTALLAPCVFTHTPWWCSHVYARAHDHKDEVQP